jgi:hypothetical protein
MYVRDVGPSKRIFLLSFQIIQLEEEIFSVRLVIHPFKLNNHINFYIFYAIKKNNK